MNTSYANWGHTEKLSMKNTNGTLTVKQLLTETQLL